MLNRKISQNMVNKITQKKKMNLKKFCMLVFIGVVGTIGWLLLFIEITCLVYRFYALDCNYFIFSDFVII